MREFVARPAWMTLALCRGLDPNLFHQERGEVFPSVLGDLCSACPVRTDCLTFSLRVTPDVGRWGGTSVKERRRLRSHGEVKVRDGWALYDPDSGEVVFVTDQAPLSPDEAVAAVVAWLAGPLGATA